MRKPHNRWFLAAGAAVLLIGASFTPVGEAAADSMKAQLVRIVNDVTDPVLVRDVEQPARQTFRGTIDCLIGPGDDSCQGAMTVPLGKFLVIETLSGAVNLPTGEQGRMSVIIFGSGPLSTFAVPLQFSFTNALSAADSYSGLHPARLYAGPGEQVTLSFDRNAGSSSAIPRLTVSGYLVDCGPGPGCPLPQGS